MRERIAAWLMVFAAVAMAVEASYPVKCLYAYVLIELSSAGGS